MGDSIDSARLHAVIETLYGQHYNAMLRLAMGMTGHHSAAEDACHNVFQKLLTSHRPLAAYTLNYLLIATRNDCLNQLQQRRRFVILEDSHPAPTPPDTDEAQWVETLLAEWHASLTDPQEEAITRQENGESCEAIAAAMGCKVRTVHTHLYRAHRKLDALVAQERERERERERESEPLDSGLRRGNARHRR